MTQEGSDCTNQTSPLPAPTSTDLTTACTNVNRPHHRLHQRQQTSPLPAPTSTDLTTACTNVNRPHHCLHQPDLTTACTNQTSPLPAPTRPHHCLHQPDLTTACTNVNKLSASFHHQKQPGNYFLNYEG